MMYNNGYRSHRCWLKAQQKSEAGARSHTMRGEERKKRGKKREKREKEGKKEGRDFVWPNPP